MHSECLEHEICFVFKELNSESIFCILFCKWHECHILYKCIVKRKAMGPIEKVNASAYLKGLS